MAYEYTVWAKSPSLNQQIRQFHLAGGQNNKFRDEHTATLWAQSFAQQLNERKHMTATDWAPIVKYEDVGMHTLVNSMNSLKG